MSEDYRNLPILKITQTLTFVFDKDNVLPKENRKGGDKGKIVFLSLQVKV